MIKTAADLAVGDFLHRVQQSPRSCVFQDTIDEVVVSVAPHATAAGIVTIVLDTPYKSTLNLAADRQVQTRTTWNGLTANA